LVLRQFQNPVSFGTASLAKKAVPFGFSSLPLPECPCGGRKPCRVFIVPLRGAKTLRVFIVAPAGGENPSGFSSVLESCS
jgi:hypothetical protein